jgi:hypothetical protein
VSWGFFFVNNNIAIICSHQIVLEILKPQFPNMERAGDFYRITYVAVILHSLSRNNMLERAIGRGGGGGGGRGEGWTTIV